jgi:hypothetical protein
MHMRKMLVSAAVAAVALGSAGTALAVSGGSSLVYSGCVTGTSRVLENVHKAASVRCPKGSFEISWNQTGPQGPPGQPVTASAVFTLSGRDDSGSGGNNWATDNITRTVTVTRQASVPASNCGTSATQCWFYTMTVSDTGTFTTQPGLTPNQGCTEPNGGPSCSGLDISGTVVGTLSGGGDQEFYADQAGPVVPKTLSYTGDAPLGTGEWYKLFFPSSANFGFAPATSAGQPWTSWSWSYAAPATCETWTDAYNNGAGSGTFAADGNIAGINQCH